MNTSTPNALVNAVVKAGRRRALPLAAVITLDPCPEQADKVKTLAVDGHIPLTRATLKKALALGLDWGWFARHLGNVRRSSRNQADHPPPRTPP